MIFSRIMATGSYLPERIMTNAELESLVNTSDEWIRERTGIRQRHIVADDESTCDLAERAARAALESADVDPAELDLIVVGTTTPDKIYPATACRLQARLGANGCTAFDLQAVCTGFIYALGVADKFIKSGEVKRALVIGADTHSRLLDWSDRQTCILFGDGGGAVVLEASDEPGIYSTHLHADGSYEDLLYVDGGVPRGAGVIAEGNAYTKMRGNEVFKIAVRTLRRIVAEALDANNMTSSDIDWLIPHQANIRIIEATARKLDIPADRVIVTIAEHGNTSAASVPLALDVAVRDGRVKRGDNILLEAFGGGFTWGSALIRY
ncbi:MAG: beta-ketoacyl-ACP synthase III [Gammaproteobacteria bacterium]|nr:beta-ketoacyl-ACP synthase III [Gammaproteobacteria bacterium]MDX2461556.1 beta-ketoacyl-ACP synthase III [Gammaproteobacteria bacterium]